MNSTPESNLISISDLEEKLKETIGSELFQSAINFAFDFACIEAKEYANVSYRDNRFVEMCNFRRYETIITLYNTVVDCKSPVVNLELPNKERIRKVLDEAYGVRITA